MHSCRLCGTPLTKKPGPGRWPHFCSSLCKSRARRPHSTPRPEATPAECTVCGSPFVSKSGGRHCSEACRAKAYRASQGAKGRERNRQRNRENYAARCAVAFVECTHCGALFCAKSSRARVCYSDKCQRRANAIRLRPYMSARRARLRGAMVEMVNPLQVFERDGWVCGICELSVDPELRWPEPGSVSLDHVVPLSLGGSHSYGNVRCAHLYCNTVKGARSA